MASAEMHREIEIKGEKPTSINRYGSKRSEHVKIDTKKERAKEEDSLKGTERAKEEEK